MPLEPIDPAAVDVPLVHRVRGIVAWQRVADELDGHAVVAQRVVQAVRLHDGDAVVADERKDQCRRFDLRDEVMGD
jgi:hypothetical protein